MDELFNRWGLTQAEVAALLKQTGSMGNPCQVCLQLAERMHTQPRSSELANSLHEHALGCANGRLLLTYYYEPPAKTPRSNA